jgi:hypothetical protein
METNNYFTKEVIEAARVVFHEYKSKKESIFFDLLHSYFTYPIVSQKPLIRQTIRESSRLTPSHFAEILKVLNGSESFFVSVQADPDSKTKYLLFCYGEGSVALCIFALGEKHTSSSFYWNKFHVHFQSSFNQARLKNIREIYFF